MKDKKRRRKSWMEMEMTKKKMRKLVEKKNWKNKKMWKI
jgi:hypothetical protein